MGNLNRTITHKGASGNAYAFDVYTSDTDWRDGAACVYYVSKRDSAGNHIHIYVGETEDLKNRHLDHHKQQCFERSGYNCISILMESNATKRLQIEKDLVRALTLSCQG
jgi:predicted GIY-YIG superfamily endonuclease